MSAHTDPIVKDAPPPRAALSIVNPLLRLVLRTPISRAIDALAILEFTGRRTGDRRRVVVGWHIVDGTPTVLTPAAWRANFTEPRLAAVRWRGSESAQIGTLDSDPDVVARAVNTLIEGGASARSLALEMPTGHIVTAQDIVDTHRAIIRFEAAS